MRGIGLWRLLRLLLKVFVGNKTGLASLPECGRRREGIWGCIASWWLRFCVGVEESRVWTAREGYCRGFGGAELFSQKLTEEFCCKSFVYLLCSSLRRFRISFRVLVDHKSLLSPLPQPSQLRSPRTTQSHSTYFVVMIFVAYRTSVYIAPHLQNLETFTCSDPL
jgi:hypothetical protein